MGISLSDDPDLLAFVRLHVRSVWALELLLLLRREPARRWAPAELVRELRASPGLVSDNLRVFERGGLAVPDQENRHQYAPATPLLDALCARLEDAYRARPVSVINMIARPSDPLQSLADAFRFRGDPE